MTAYYNEIDPYAAKWLRNLIEAGHIPAGDVDERSIRDVRSTDLAGYVQCHFFAGLGGWSRALRLVGWSDSRHVWTGSCPCQSLSSAGQRKGHADPRHLWPAFHDLIAECRPAIVFGEQVASADGREWLSGVRADLEALDYASGASDLCAAGVGAPHPRQRLYWLAYSHIACENRWPPGWQQSLCDGLRDASQGLANADGRIECGRPGEEGAAPSESQGEVGQQDRQRLRLLGFGDSGAVDRLGHAKNSGLQGEWSEYRPRGERHSGLVGLAMQVGVPEWNGPTVAVECSDGPRRVSAQPDSFPLAHGVSGRMGRLRAYGNAIVPQVAAQFIAASIEAIA